MTLSRYIRDLPVPNFYEEVDYESVRNALLEDLRTRLSGWTQEVSDPLYIQSEAFASYAVALREYFNNRSLAQLLRWATGSGLRHIGASRGIPQEEDEDEEAYRARIELTPLARILVGSPTGVVSNALISSREVKDANYIRQADLSLIVYILSTAAKEGVIPAGTPSVELISTVETHLTDDSRFGWAERLVVNAPIITEYNITARVEYDSNDIEVNRLEPVIKRNLEIFAEDRLRLGIGVPLSAIYAAIEIEGVVKSEVTLPNSGLLAGTHGTAYALDTITLNMVDVA